MSRIELTDGSPVPTDGSHTEILPSGQQRAYVVLSQEERAKGFVKPLRRSYVHSKCGVTTTMGRSIAETYARDPRFYTGTFCVRCRAHFSLSEFVWEDGEPMNPNDQDEWQRTEGERRRKARIARLQNLVAQLRSDLAAAERDLSQCTSDQPSVCDHPTGATVPDGDGWKCLDCGYSADKGTADCELSNIADNRAELSNTVDKGTADRRAALDELTRQSQELGLYDTPESESPVTGSRHGTPQVP